jgi:Spy/CpxP family protein refolding chaperone
MNVKLQILLVAVAFAALGTGVTFLGFRLALPDGAGISAVQDDTATTAAQPGRRARSARPAAGRGPDPIARARGPSGRGGRGPGAGAGRILAALADELELTPAQRQAWGRMLQNVRSTCGTEGLQGDGLAIDLIEAASADPQIAPEALHGQLDTRLDQQRAAAHCALDELLAFEATLSPEQRAVVTARVGHFAERRQAWIDGWPR